MCVSCHGTAVCTMSILYVYVSKVMVRNIIIIVLLKLN